MTGSVTFTPDEADVIAATRTNYLHAVRRPKALRNGAIIAAVAALVGGGIAAIDGLSRSWTAIFMLGGALYGAVLWGIILGITLLLLPGRTRRLFRQHRSIQKAFDYRWSDDGLEWTAEHGGARLPWSDLHGWRESPSTFMIYSNDTLFQFLPRRAFAPGMEDDLRATLVRSGLPVY